MSYFYSVELTTLLKFRDYALKTEMVGNTERPVYEQTIPGKYQQREQKTILGYPSYKLCTVAPANQIQYLHTIGLS